MHRGGKNANTDCPARASHSRGGHGEEPITRILNRLNPCFLCSGLKEIEIGLSNFLFFCFVSFVFFVASSRSFRCFGVQEIEIGLSSYLFIYFCAFCAFCGQLAPPACPADRQAGYFFYP
jgi:hypothetical protein